MSKREIVIRLQLPATLRKRWLLGGGVAILLLGAVAYAALPVTFQSHTIVTAADLNSNFTNLDGRVTTLESKALPTVAWGSSTTSALVGGPASAGVAHISINVPGDGYVKVDASFNVILNNNSGGLKNCGVDVQLDNTVRAVDVSRGSSVSYYVPSTITSYDSGGSAYLHVMGSLTGLFPVTGAGAKSLYLNASQNGPCTSWNLRNVAMTALYIPNGTATNSVSFP